MIDRSKFTQPPPEGYGITQKYFVEESIFYMETRQYSDIEYYGFKTFEEARKFSCENTSRITIVFRNKEG